MDGSFEDIDFGGGPPHERAVIVLGPRVFLTGTGATREPLTWEVRKGILVVLVAWVEGNIWYAIQSLVGNGADITRVVGVRPLYIKLGSYGVPQIEWDAHHSLQTGTVPSPSEIAHPPDGGPQTSNAAFTGQGHGGLNVASRETKLIPTGHHPTLVVQVVSLLLRERDLEGAVLGGDSGRVVPLEIAGLPVVEVDSFPVWIVAGVERTTVVVEFVREDQLKF